VTAGHLKDLLFIKEIYYKGKDDEEQGLVKVSIPCEMSETSGFCKAV
jgi:hypothetical protein